MYYYAIIDGSGKVTNVVDSLSPVRCTSNFIRIASCDKTLIGKYYVNNQFVTEGEYYVGIVKTADGAGSGLDADMLDGQSGGDYLTMTTANLTETETSDTWTVTVTGDITSKAVLIYGTASGTVSVNKGTITMAVADGNTTITFVDTGSADTVKAVIIG